MKCLDLRTVIVRIPFMHKNKFSRFKNRLINLSLTMGMVLILFIIYLFVFNSYKKALVGFDNTKKFAIDTTKIGLLTRADIVQLGWIQHPQSLPPSSYFNFRPAKPEGIYRIGIFGCSYVNGIGTLGGNDFPTRLQEKYREAGLKEVEVLNFGVSGYGMNRSFYLWNKLAKHYDLDLTIFNVHSFHFKRDQTFCFNQKQYSPIHGRYILTDGKLQYIAALGNNRLEAANQYFTPIPARQYWMYEAKTPPPIKALMSRNRELKKNPFYYHPDPAWEGKMLYAAIFDSIARASSRLIVTLGDTQVAGVREYLTDPNITLLPLAAHDLKRKYPTIYEAYDKHPNTLGYQLIAEELFDHLQDSADIEFPALFLEPNPNLPISYSPNWEPLQTVKRIYFGIEGKELAVWVPSSNSIRTGRAEDTDPIIDYDKWGAKALLVIPTKGNYYVLPLQEPFLPDTSHKIQLRYRVDGTEKVADLTDSYPLSTTLGTVDSLAAIYQLDVGKMELVKWGEAFKVRFRTTQEISHLTIEINNTPIWYGKKGKSSRRAHIFSLIPTVGELINIKGDFDQQIDLHQLPPKGMIDLMIEYKTGAIKSLPFVGYKVENVKVAQ